MKKKRFQHSICFSSVEDMPEAKGSVVFTTDSAKVFKDDVDISPITLSDGTQYMPWGGGPLLKRRSWCARPTIHSSHNMRI